jgi:hypothetical protein
MNGWLMAGGESFTIHPVTRLCRPSSTAMLGQYTWVRVEEHMLRSICLDRVGEHMLRSICLDWVGEHNLYSKCLDRVEEHMLKSICLNRVGEHIISYYYRRANE